MLLTENRMYIEDIQRIVNLKYDWDKIDGHSFLIIGASGMIGSCLIDLLMLRNKRLNADIRIWAMGRNRERLEERFQQYLKEPHFQLVTGDVREPIERNIQADYIIHGASNTHPKAYAADPIGTIMTNLAGTEQVLKHAVATEASRVLFLSTVEIYGENRGDVKKFPEDYCGYIDCNTLRAGYPEGKRVSESLCQAYREAYGVDIVIPRLARTFGPTMLLGDSKASSQFIMNAVFGKNIILKSEGNQLFSYTYVCDVVSSMLFLLIYGEDGEAYNVSDSMYDLKLKNLAEFLAKIGNSKVIMEMPTEDELKGYSKVVTALIDSNKIKNLGWKSIYSLEESLRHTVEILRENILE